MSLLSYFSLIIGAPLVFALLVYFFIIKKKPEGDKFSLKFLGFEFNGEGKLASFLATFLVAEIIIAISFFMFTLKPREETTDFESQINHAQLETLDGKYESSNSRYKDIIDLVRQPRDWSFKAKAFEGLGKNYAKIRDYERAQESYESANSLYMENNDLQGKTRVQEALNKLKIDVDKRSEKTKDGKQ